MGSVGGWKWECGGKGIKPGGGRGMGGRGGICWWNGGGTPGGGGKEGRTPGGGITGGGPLIGGIEGGKPTIVGGIPKLIYLKFFIYFETYQGVSVGVVVIVVIPFPAFSFHDEQHSQTVDALTSSPASQLAFVRSSQSVMFILFHTYPTERKTHLWKFVHN